MKKREMAGSILALVYLTCFQTSSMEAAFGNDCLGNLEPCYAPEGCCQNNGCFSVDFLWWSANFNAISGIDVGILAEEGSADATIHVSHPTQDWDPGVRLTAGWGGCNDWEVMAKWTYFRNRVISNEAPFDLQIISDSFNTTGNSKFTLQYNAADLEWGKALYPACDFFIQPILGIHALWTNVNSHLHLIAPPSTLAGDGFDVDINLRVQSWGVGPKIGVNTSWGHCRGFSLLGNAFGALVYGEHKSHADAEVDITSDVDINIHVIGKSYWQLMPVAQLQAGIGYTGCFCTNKQYNFAALWETNVIHQANNILIFDKKVSMQGLTLSLGCVF